MCWIHLVLVCGSLKLFVWGILYYTLLYSTISISLHFYATFRLLLVAKLKKIRLIGPFWRTHPWVWCEFPSVWNQLWPRTNNAYDGFHGKQESNSQKTSGPTVKNLLSLHFISSDNITKPRRNRSFMEIDVWVSIRFYLYIFLHQPNCSFSAVRLIYPINILQISLESAASTLSCDSLFYQSPTILLTIFNPLT